MWPKICIPYTYTSSAPYEWLAMARGGPRDAPGKRRRVARWWKDTFSRPVDIVQYGSISYEHHEQCFDNRNWCQILSIKSIMSLYILRALDMTTEFKKLKLLKMQWQTRMTKAVPLCFKSFCRHQWFISSFFKSSSHDWVQVGMPWSSSSCGEGKSRNRGQLGMMRTWHERCACNIVYCVEFEKLC